MEGAPHAVTAPLHLHWYAGSTSTNEFNRVHVAVDVVLTPAVIVMVHEQSVPLVDVVTASEHRWIHHPSEMRQH